MHKNVGCTDRTVRIIGGIAILAVTASGTVTGVAGLALATVGAVLALTGLLKFCPLYRVLGISTCDTSGSSGSCASKGGCCGGGSCSSKGTDA